MEMYIYLMSDPSIGRQMDPVDSKQAAGRHKLLHPHWILPVTQTTLPSPPIRGARCPYHDRF